MLDFITPSSNLIHFTLSGDSPESVLRDLLEKLSLETIENLQTTYQGSSEVYRLDDNLYIQETYQVVCQTAATADKLDPDSVA